MVCVCVCINLIGSCLQMWSDLIQKAKEGGLDTIETYIFWNAHEPRRREVGNSPACLI